MDNKGSNAGVRLSGSKAAPSSFLPNVSMQQLVNAGLNAFALQLFVESVAGKTDARTFTPFSFVYKGVKVSLEPVAEVDTRHS